MAKGRLIDACKTFDRKLRVTFEIDGEIPLDKEHELEISVKRWREKRSLDANAYLWVLVGKIADALRESKEEIYFDSLKCYGQGGAVSVEERFAEDFKRSYKYHEELGRSDLNGKTFVHFRFGSAAPSTTRKRCPSSSTAW